MKNQINSGFLWALMITIFFGMLEFGLGIASFSSFLGILFDQYKEHANPYFSNMDDFNSFVTTTVPIGAAIGSFSGGILAKMGRRKAIILTNMII